MKKNDIALIVLIISISLVVSYFILRAFIGNPQDEQAKVQVVEPISAQLVDPSPKVFYKDAINPTIVIKIGDPSNQQPFGE